MTRAEWPAHAVKLSVVIQHHPARPDLPKRLRKQLQPTQKHITGRIQVVADPDPGGPRNPWRGARECWRRMPECATHQLVIQDDVLPCRDFLKHARNAIAARPDRIIAFYVGTNAFVTHRTMLVAAAAGQSWVQGFFASWVPALALSIPAPLVPSLVAFDDGTETVADDEVYGRWCRTNSLPWYATIPSLVDHDDYAPSLMRSVHAGGRRVAACWIGECDPGLIDWTRG